MAQINCFPSIPELARALCWDFHHYITGLARTKKQINIAISGGNTPKAFFERLASNQEIPDKKINWINIHLFWVDERCVPPDHPDSNFGMTYRCLLQKISFAESNIHRIRGENNPSEEAVRYGKEILRYVDLLKGIPIFDWILLGIGDDGHTASIFPNRLELFETKKICETAKHPVTGQYRITITGPTIVHANRISFLATGEAKSKVIRHILHNEPEASQYPASFIKPVQGKLEWYLDDQAAKYINT
jgi:6-phosphogluconolactonase